MPRQRGGHEEEHENHEAWVIPYADMLTLLMVMFLAMYAMGNIDLQKFRRLADAFNREINGGRGAQVVDAGIMTGEGNTVINGGQGVLQGGAAADGSGTGRGGDGVIGAAATAAAQTWPLSNVIGELTNRDQRAAGQRALAREEAAAQAAAAERKELAEVRQEIRDRVAQAGLADRVEFRQTERGLTITLLTDQVLFQPGSAELQPGADQLLAGLAEVLRDTAKTIEVVGHTDSTPTNGGQFASNWELSGARAGSVVRYLIERVGIAPERLRLAGVGDTQPIAPNDTPEGRAKNRRVEITILAGTAVPQTATADPGEVPAASPPTPQARPAGALAEIEPATSTEGGSNG